VNTTLSNLRLFAFAIAKAAILTGLAPAVILAFCCERVKVLKIGFEQVSGDGQLAPQRILIPANLSSGATSASRNQWRMA